MADTFTVTGPPKELTEAEQMHVKAVKAAADNLLHILKGNRPDPRCMAIAITKLEECVMWAQRGIEKGFGL